MTKFHYRFRRFCAVLIGIVFFISGVLKLMDPVGAGLLITEYFKFFHLGFLIPAAKVCGVLLSLTESVTGAALITGVFRKASAWTATALIVIFTAITLVLLIGNPPMDCGCFGEAIKLSHLQSFVKNVILLSLACGAFIPYRSFGHPKNKKYVSFGLVAAGLIAGMVYSLVYLPSIDYTPFAPGSELYAAQDNPDQADENLLPAYIYERNGRRGSFALNALPDSTWTFVGIDTLVRENYIYPKNIPILSFTDADGEYRDEIATEGGVVVLSVYRPEKLTKKDWLKWEEYKERAENNGITPLFLLASSPSEADWPPVSPSVRKSIYFADYKTLITLNRSNGGATYFDDGTVVRKWARNYFPKNEELAWLSGEGDPTDETLTTVAKGRLRFQGFLLYAFAVMILI